MKMSSFSLHRIRRDEVWPGVLEVVRTHTEEGQ